MYALHVLVITGMNELSIRSLSLSVLTANFPGKPGLAGYIGAKDDGSGSNNWSYKSCKAPVKSSPLTNQHPVFYRPDALSPNRRRNALKGRIINRSALQFTVFNILVRITNIRTDSHEQYDSTLCLLTYLLTY